MKFELPDEIVEEATIACLKESYDNTYEILIDTFNNDLTAVHSFDFDEEIFALIQDLRALERILDSNFGVSIKKPVDLLLKELDEELYLQEKTFEELKKTNQTLVNKNNKLTEELDELRDKIKNILG
jgi:uncharacterized coiled-coil protein SlyX